MIDSDWADIVMACKYASILLRSSQSHALAARAVVVQLTRHVTRQHFCTKMTVSVLSSLASLLWCQTFTATTVWTCDQAKALAVIAPVHSGCASRRVCITFNQ